MGFGWPWMARVWTLITGGAAYAVKTASRSAFYHDNEQKPRDILKERYAEGGMTREEFGRQYENLKTS